MLFNRKPPNGLCPLYLAQKEPRTVFMEGFHYVRISPLAFAQKDQDKIRTSHI